MARSLPVENLIPQNMGPIINFLHYFCLSNVDLKQNYCDKCTFEKTLKYYNSTTAVTPTAAATYTAIPKVLLHTPILCVLMCV